MATRRERIVLELEDNFTRVSLAARLAARSWDRQRALRLATWEPHDWSDWEV